MVELRYVSCKVQALWSNSVTNHNVTEPSRLALVYVGCLSYAHPNGWRNTENHCVDYDYDYSDNQYLGYKNTNYFNVDWDNYYNYELDFIICFNV